MITKPVVFENHFCETRKTTVLGNWCLNGCQLFHKDRAKHVFERFQVNKSQQLDVMNAFTDKAIDFNKVMLFMFMSKTDRYDELFASACDDIEILKDILLSRHASDKVRKIIAMKNITELNLMMISDHNETWGVLEKISRLQNLDVLECLTHHDDHDLRANANYTLSVMDRQLMTVKEINRLDQLIELTK